MSLLAYRGEIVKHSILVGIILLLSHYGTSFSCARIDQSFARMDPVVPAGAIAFLQRSQATRNEFKVDDIVCFRQSHAGGQSTWVGRVLALPGETIEIDNNHAVVNGTTRPLASDKALHGLTIPRILVPSGYLFVVYDTPSLPDRVHRDNLIPISSVIGHFNRMIAF